jgi:hypothetical protein
MVDESILTSLKKVLGLAEEDSSFDRDVILHINSVFATLNQLGLGPTEGFMITDSSAIWSEYITDDINYNAVKSYMFLRVRLLFDPPTNSFLVSSFEKQILELEWRLNIIRETAIVPPTEPPV